MAEALVDKTIAKWKNKRWIAVAALFFAGVAAIAGFSESLTKLYQFYTAVIDDKATAVVLPNDSGWIFGGYYDEGVGKFIQGPYFKIVHSNYNDKQVLPRLGDRLRITSERNIVIADFATLGLTKQFQPPWQQNVLAPGDYTGWKLPRGATVEVRDVSSGSFPGRPDAVWIRVGAVR
jgi:hypothetical protein